jgi:acetyl-CoA synthetase
VVAFAVVRDGDFDRDELLATAEHNVGRAFAPRLHIVRTVPKTKNGKIMRRAIRAQYLGTPPGDLSSLDPSTPLHDIPTHEEIGDLQ